MCWRKWGYDYALKSLGKENAMTIALHLLAAYIKCPSKCWLMSNGEPITDNRYTQWAQAQNEAYLASEIQRLLSETGHEECIISPAAGDLKTGKWRLAANVLTRTQHLESHIHAVERLPPEGRGKTARYCSIRFVPNNKLGKDTKLLLAFDALALSELLGEKVSLGRIVHGDDHTKLLQPLSRRSLPTRNSPSERSNIRLEFSGLGDLPTSRIEDVVSTDLESYF